MGATVWKLGLAALILCFSVGVAACGLGPVGHAEYPSPAGAVITYTVAATVTSATDYHTTLTASCEAGEQLLAGGYSATDVWESDFMLDASYPSTPGAWTISAQSSSHFDLHALVYCLRGGPALGERIVPSVACPAGTTPLSQGQRGAGAPYMVCAAHGVTRGATPGAFQVGAFAAHCASSSTGANLSETRSFAYTCQFHQTSGY